MNAHSRGRGPVTCNATSSIIQKVARARTIAAAHGLFYARQNVRQRDKTCPHSSRSKTKQNQANARPAGSLGAALSLTLSRGETDETNTPHFVTAQVMAFLRKLVCELGTILDHYRGDRDE